MKPFASVARYLRGVRTEFKKVQWPDRQKFMRSFWLVIVSVIIAALVLAAIDSGLQSLIKSILL